MEEEHDNVEALASGQLRSTIEDEDMSDVTSDLGSDEDLLAEFDVESDEKDFLAEMLRLAPKDEIEKLQKARDEELDYDKPIREFIKAHPIYEQLRGDVDDVVLAEFQNDVFEFSQATGRSKERASADALGALAAWIQYVGLGDTLLNGGELEIKKGTPILTNAKEYYNISGNGEGNKKKKKKKKKKGKDQSHENNLQLPTEIEDDGNRAPIFVDVSKAESVTPTIPTTRRKRKRGSSQVVMSKSQDNPTISNTKALPTQQTVADSRKPKKMRPKPGPTTSAYFATTQASLVEPSSSKMVENSLPSKQSQNQQKHRALVAQDAEKSSLVVHEPRPSHSINSTHAENLEMDTGSIHPNPEPNRNTTDNVMTEAAVSEIRSTNDPTDEAANSRKKRKRRRKRNNNRLDETHLVESTQSLNLGSRPSHSRETSDRMPTEASPKTRNVVHFDNEDQDESNYNPGSLDAKFLAKRKRGEHDDQAGSSKRQATTNETENAAGEQGEPPTQLENVNANNQKRERRDRGRGRKHSSVAEPRVESNDQQVKDRHS